MQGTFPSLSQQTPAEPETVGRHRSTWIFKGFESSWFVLLGSSSQEASPRGWEGLHQRSKSVWQTGVLWHGRTLSQRTRFSMFEAWRRKAKSCRPDSDFCWLSLRAERTHTVLIVSSVQTGGTFCPSISAHTFITPEWSRSHLESENRTGPSSIAET